MAEVPDLTAEFLEERLELLSCVGLRVQARLDGEVALDISVGVDGLGRELQPDSLHAIYCAGKPLLAVALGRLVDEGELSWDDQLGWIIEEHLHPAVARATVGQVASHSAGFGTIPAEQATVVPPDERRRIARMSAPSVEQRAYGEFQGWTLLGLCVEALTDRTHDEVIEATVIAPLGLAGEIVARFTEENFYESASRIAVNVDHRHRPPLPLLAERTAWMGTDWNPAYGGYSTADGLAAFYSALIDPPVGSGLSLATIEHQTTSVWHGHDRSMGRECSYGLGFMTDLVGHDVSQHCGADSFGHSGNAGMSLGFADPSKGLAVAAMFNGMTDGRTATQFRRPIVVDAIYRSLGLV